MSLFHRQVFEAEISRHKAVEIVHQWGDASVGKVGGKIFAILSFWREGSSTISFKCSDLSFQMLPELTGIMPAKYLARAKWVDVSANSELSEEDIKAYVQEAHRLVASKLTRRKRDELGLG